MSDGKGGHALCLRKRARNQLPSGNLVEYRRRCLRDEERELLRSRLRNEKVALTPEKSEQTARQLEHAMTCYLHADRPLNPESGRGELAELLRLSLENNSSIREIRLRVRRLSLWALAYIERQGHNWLDWTIVHDDEAVGCLWCWERHASDDLLVESLPRVIVQGLRIVPGRRRPDGTRPMTISYVIDGVAAGIPSRKKQGRPPEEPKLNLARHVAHIWEHSVGLPLPKKIRRGQRSGLSGFVHDVFQWCGLDGEEADYALRCLRAEQENWALPAVPARGEHSSPIHPQLLFARNFRQQSSRWPLEHDKEPPDVARAKAQGFDTKRNGRLLQDIHQHARQAETGGTSSTISENRTFSPVRPTRPRRVAPKCSSPFYI